MGKGWKLPHQALVMAVNSTPSGRIPLDKREFFAGRGTYSYVKLITLTFMFMPT
jgi:hypothetical protein